MHAGFITIIGVLGFTLGMIYRIAYFREKKVGYLQLFQVAYLVVIPGVIYPMIFAYLRRMSSLPLNKTTVFPDGLLVNLVLLSGLFSFAGLVMHAVTKQLWLVLKDDERSPAYELNSHFHLTISHNLMYSGAAMAFIGVTLLELNHVPMTDPTSVIAAIAKGLLLGGSFLFMVFNYRPYTTGRWTDLKTFFLVLWLGFVLLLYGIAKVDPSFTEYQLLLPTLISFSVMALLSMVIVVRKVGKGWKVYLSQKRLQKMMLIGEEEWS
jgi:hypothetical protein